MGIPDQNKESNRFAYIDAVRGLAFLAVLLNHSAHNIGHFFGREVLTYGVFGVQTFFLISAITLCFSMEARREVDKLPVINFYLRRLFRIAPLFWCAMVFYWMFPDVMPAFWLAQWSPDGTPPAYFVLTGLFIHGWHPHTFNSVVPGGWAIAVEMPFYLIFPVIYHWLGHSVKRTMAAVILGMISIKLFTNVFPWLHGHFFQTVPDYVWNFFISRWFPSQLPAFLIGFLAYHCIANSSIKNMVKNRTIAACLFGVGSIVLISLARGFAGRFMPEYILITLVLAFIIVVCSGGSVPLLVNPVLCYVGKISYGCYLAHFAALGITLKLLGIHLTADATFFDAGSSAANFFLFLKLSGIALALTVVFATITRRLIENPGIALGKKLIQRINTSSTVKCGAIGDILFH